MQDTVDQDRASNTKINLTKAGVEFGIMAMINPTIAIGIMQYPIALID